MYKEGRGVERDYTAALEWYRKAATEGDAEAQFTVGLMYDAGRGADQNYIKAANCIAGQPSRVLRRRS